MVRDWLRVGPKDGFHMLNGKLHPLAVVSVAVASQLKICVRDTEFLQKSTIVPRKEYDPINYILEL